MKNVLYSMNQNLFKSNQSEPTLSSIKTAALFQSMVRPSVQPNPLFKSALQTGGIWKRCISFSCKRKLLKNGAFGKRCRHENHVISLSEFSWNTNPNTGISSLVWTRSIWCAFKVKPYKEALHSEVIISSWYSRLKFTAFSLGHKRHSCV